MSYIRTLIPLSLFCIFIAFGCNNSGENTIVTLSDSTNKSSAKDPLNTLRNDEAVEPDQKDILSEYIKGYDKKKIIDTSYQTGKDKFHLHLEHYCLFDSNIHEPKKYVALYGLDSFITHSFEANIILKKNGVEVLNSKIRKENFDSMPVDSSLVNYGALLYPTFRFVNENAEIGFSISIPLTDVGVGMSVRLDNNGKLTYKNP